VEEGGGGGERERGRGIEGGKERGKGGGGAGEGEEVGAALLTEREWLVIGIIRYHYIITHHCNI